MNLLPALPPRRLAMALRALKRLRLTPATLGGQLIATMLIAVLAAHAAAIVVRQLTPDVMHPLAARYMLDRVAGVYQAIRLSPDQAEQLVNAISTPAARFWLSSDKPQTGIAMNQAEQAQARALTEKLPRAPAPRNWVQLTGQASADEDKEDKKDEEQVGMLVAVELADGRWLLSYQHSPGSSPWWRPLFFSIPVSTLPVLLVTLPFIGRILRPIRALERAAERFSRGEHTGPLPVTGPREARELTAVFNTMAERQQRYTQERTRMLAAISHDLRTPITSLRLRAELIDDAELRGAMSRTLAAMSLMVEQTLRFAAADSVSEPSQDIDLAALLRDLAADMARPGVHVHYTGPATLPYRCRPLALRRALANLAENAVRHGTTVTLHAQTATPENLVLSVTDNGPGIPEHELERVFHPFAQLDPARSRDSGSDHGGSGVGLGLSIARSCVEAHGGTLVLSNGSSGGLVATVTLPG
ncbi:MAG: ATP-binding protein [Duganella sp.]